MPGLENESAPEVSKDPSKILGDFMPKVTEESRNSIEKNPPPNHEILKPSDFPGVFKHLKTTLRQETRGKWVPNMQATTIADIDGEDGEEYHRTFSLITKKERGQYIFSASPPKRNR